MLLERLASLVASASEIAEHFNETLGCGRESGMTTEAQGLQRWAACDGEAVIKKSHKPACLFFKWRSPLAGLATGRGAGAIFENGRLYTALKKIVSAL